MFNLRDLPSPQTLQGFAKRYPQIDPSAAEACLALLRVGSDLLSALEVCLVRHGMSQGRFSVLMLLNREPERGLNPSDLAARAGVTRATMTGLLDGLEREGLVKRSPVDGDRRMLSIRLTPCGRQYLDERLPDYFRRVAAAMAQLSGDERRSLVQLLQKVGAGLPVLHEP